jgi:hypothetical protein
MPDNVETWSERAERMHGNNEVVTSRMIQMRMQEEINDLRQALAQIERTEDGNG